MEKYDRNKRNEKRKQDGEKKLIKQRREVNRLYYEEEISKNKIIKKKGMSKGFVIKWTASPDMDFTEDKRGWPLGKRRKWGKEKEERIKEIHKELNKTPKEYFIGATVIMQEWRKRYPGETIPPLRTIGRMLKEMGLTNKMKKGRNKGAARYLNYPEYTLYNLLGGRILEADFIKKNIRKRTEPVTFMGFSYKKAPKLRYYIRLEGETSKDFIRGCKQFIDKFGYPDYIKVDNGAAMSGSMSAKRSLSKAIIYLLERRIAPIFAVPRRPFSQASIEGNNSIFSRKFWNIKEYKNIEQIDEELEWFNDASIRYSAYNEKKRGKKALKEFEPKVYLIRQVSENEETNKGEIRVFNEMIDLPGSYIKYFVLAEWDLKKEKLYVRYEVEKTSKIIKEIDFKINETSRKNLKKGGLLSFGI